MGRSRLESGGRRHRNLTLSEEADAVLKRQAIASRYVDGLVLRVRDEWRDALAYLLESGLDRAQVRAMVSSIDATTPLPWRGDIPSVGAATAMLVREWRIGNTELQRSLE